MKHKTRYKLRRTKGLCGAMLFTLLISLADPAAASPAATSPAVANLAVTNPAAASPAVTNLAATSAITIGSQEVSTLPDIHLQSETEPGEEAEPEMEIETEDEAIISIETETEREDETEAEKETEIESDTEIEAETETEDETEAEAETEAETGEEIPLLEISLTALTADMGTWISFDGLSLTLGNAAPDDVQFTLEPLEVWSYPAENLAGEAVDLSALSEWIHDSSHWQQAEDEMSWMLDIQWDQTDDFGQRLLPDGSYHLKILCTNQDGRISEPAELGPLMMDHTSPEIELTAPSDEKMLYVYDDYTFRLRIRDENLNQASCRFFTSDDDGQSWEVVSDDRVNWEDSMIPGEYPISIRLPVSIDHKSDGSYLLMVTAADTYGNDETRMTTSPVVVDTLPAKISVSPLPETFMHTEQGRSRAYYREALTLEIVITEKNFAEENIIWRLEAVDVQGEDVPGTVAFSQWLHEGDTHRCSVSFEGNANYSFGLSCRDAAGHMTTSGEDLLFTVNSSEPIIRSILFSEPVSKRWVDGREVYYYKSYPKLSIVAESPWAALWGAVMVCEPYSSVSEAYDDTGSVEASLRDGAILQNGSLFTARFDLDELELHGMADLLTKWMAFDKGGYSTAPYEDSRRIVIDHVSPVITVDYPRYDSLNQNVPYYARTVPVHIQVEEEHFDAANMEIFVTKNGEETPISMIWHSTGNYHSAAFSLTEDGEYTFTCRGRDLSGNEMTAYISEKLVIDSKAPTSSIRINGQTADGLSCNGDIRMTLRFSDLYFDHYSMSLIHDRGIKGREDVSHWLDEGRSAIDESGGVIVWNDLDYDRDHDGVYELTLSVLDLAGNVHSETAHFTVNRFGSTYVYDDYLKKLISHGGIFISQVEKDLIITEYNPDALDPESISLQIFRDGRPLSQEEMQVMIFEDQNHAVYGNREIESSSFNFETEASDTGLWHRYQYVFHRENFVYDGIYKILISARDRAGNHMDITQSSEGAIVFMVDHTPPEINLITGLEQAVMDGARREIRYNISDVMGLAKVEIYVNDELMDSITSFEDDRFLEGSLMIEEQDTMQRLRIVAADRAGNITDTGDASFAPAFVFEEEFILSTSPWVRWQAVLRQNLLIYLLLGLALIVMMVYGIRRRKHK